MTLPLLACSGLGKWHGARRLFEGLTVHFYPNDRVGLIGPNGTGKSTLLKIFAGLESPDCGELLPAKELRVGYVPQEWLPPDEPVDKIVADQLLSLLALDPEERLVRARIQLGKLGFSDMEQHGNTLSGGWKKRLALACALVQEPNLLLLDEPTNHLDLAGTLWLERFLQTPPCAFVLISHDRALLEAVAGRIVELDPAYPDGLLSFEGNYSRFLDHKANFLESQSEQMRSLNSKVRREVEWLRRTPAARTGKSQARVQQAHELSGELSKMRSRQQRGKTQIAFSATDRKAKRLLAVNALAKSFGERPLFHDLTFGLASGECLAVAGDNGCGKTSLLRILADELKADSGTIKRADGLRTVYFDQHREQVPPQTPLRDALSPAGDTVYYRGKPIHVNGWAQRFLFSPDRLDLPIGHLSGGERARVMIARLMLQPADLLLLDEPTNDLDIPTLEILEESLRSFQGAIVLITHDRYLLDQVATRVLGLGITSDNPMFAGYYQWEHAWSTERAERRKASSSATKAPLRKREDRQRLSYREQRELAQMEERILESEEKLALWQERAASPEYRNHSDKLQEAYHAMSAAQDEVDRLYARWQELEELKK